MKTADPVSLPEMGRSMQGLFLGLALVFSGCYAQDAQYYFSRGDVRSVKKEYDKAIADFDEAIRLNPTYADAYYARGIVWQETGKYDKAISDYSQALRINPQYASAYNNRGHVWTKKGEYDKAIGDYSQALAVNPTYAPAYSALSWLYATCPDGKYRDRQKAFENANKAYQLSEGRDWGDFDTVAAAHAEGGDFKRAKEWQAKAIEMAVNNKFASEKSKKELRGRLELYKQGKPYREERPSKEESGGD